MTSENILPEDLALGGPEGGEHGEWFDAEPGSLGGSRGVVNTFK